MKGKKEGNALPKRLKRGVERFEKWRATRQKRRIPEALWKVAGGAGERVWSPSDVACLEVELRRAEEALVVIGGRKSKTERRGGS